MGWTVDPGRRGHWKQNQEREMTIYQERGMICTVHTIKGNLNQTRRAVLQAVTVLSAMDTRLVIRVALGSTLNTSKNTVRVRCIFPMIQHHTEKSQIGLGHSAFRVRLKLAVIIGE